MLRIHHKFIQIINDRVHFENTPLTGIVYYFENGDLTHCAQHRNGYLVEDSVDLLPTRDPNKLRFEEDKLYEIEDSETEESEESYDFYDPSTEIPKFYKEKFAEGVAYLFNEDGLLIWERLYCDGIPMSQLNEYYKNGMLKEKFTPLSQISWDENGNLSSLREKISERTSCTCNLTEQGKLSKIFASKDFFQLRKTKNFDFTVIYKEIHFFGEGLDDNFFKNLITFQKFTSVEKINLDDTRISLPTLLKVIDSCCNLKRLDLSENELLYESDKILIEKYYPNIELIFTESERR